MVVTGGPRGLDWRGTRAGRVYVMLIDFVLVGLTLIVEHIFVVVKYIKVVFVKHFQLPFECRVESIFNMIVCSTG